MVYGIPMVYLWYTYGIADPIGALAWWRHPQPFDFRPLVAELPRDSCDSDLDSLDFSCDFSFGSWSGAFEKPWEEWKEWILFSKGCQTSLDFVSLLGNCVMHRWRLESGTPWGLERWDAFYRKISLHLHPDWTNAAKTEDFIKPAKPPEIVEHSRILQDSFW